MNKRLLIILALACVALLGSSTYAHEIKNAVASVKQKITISPNGDAQFSGTLRLKNEKSFLLKTWGGEWTITLNDKTIMRSRYDAPISYDDIADGHTMMIKGHARADVSWTIDADIIVDESVEKRETSIIGTVTSITSTDTSVNVKVRTRNFGIVTVLLTPQTKIHLPKKNSGVLTDLQNGMRLVVHGTSKDAKDLIITALDIVVKGNAGR